MTYAPGPGTTLRTIRRGNNWTLADVAERAGIPLSTLSKIENNQISPTYDQLVRLSDSLQIDLAQLFATPREAPSRQGGRRSISRPQDGEVIETPSRVLRYLNTDLLNKHFTPIMAEIKARSVEEFGELMRHPGEEFLYVIEGELELHTECYAPVVLKAGESIYFDSNMGHAYVARGKGVCRTLSICTAPNVRALAEAAMKERPEKGRTPSSASSATASSARSKRSRRMA